MVVFYRLGVRDLRAKIWQLTLDIVFSNVRSPAITSERFSGITGPTAAWMVRAGGWILFLLTDSGVRCKTRILTEH